jgi:hypothetical protein
MAQIHVAFVVYNVFKAVSITLGSQCTIDSRVSTHFYRMTMVIVIGDLLRLAFLKRYRVNWPSVTGTGQIPPRAHSTESKPSSHSCCHTDCVWLGGRRRNPKSRNKTSPGGTVCYILTLTIHFSPRFLHPVIPAYGVMVHHQHGPSALCVCVSRVCVYTNLEIRDLRLSRKRFTYSCKILGPLGTRLFDVSEWKFLSNYEISPNATWSCVQMTSRGLACPWKMYQFHSPQGQGSIFTCSP